ncbi:MAG: hypothetical protein COY40_06805 [Alphaproteobacteria bacterium CG_4_10_14_0_8_um_filter_53_9]|nr:MAG: hypothetical protein COY40_06805 [Alphaproteobacteria bacterium CG_4_10_14_0_8_um_filter_53_9]
MRFETFAFLPPLAPDQLEAQALHILKSGLIPHIEHAENPSSAEMFWKLFPIPSSRIRADGTPEPHNATHIANVIESCARRHPYSFVRLTGYNPKTGQTEAAFIAKSPQEGM